MGSSLSLLQASVLATLCALVYLAFDGGRYFLHHVSRVRLRQWSGEDPSFDSGSRWFQYNKQHFSLVTGVVAQFALIVGLYTTFRAFASVTELFAATVLASAVWLVLVLGWKFVLAATTEERAEMALRALIPLSHALYLLLFPLLYPLRILLQFLGRKRDAEEEEEDEVTDEEVQAFIDVGEEEGILEGGERRLVQSIVEFGDTLVKEVMTPRVDVAALPVGSDFSELVDKFVETKYSRLAIYDGDMDHVLGFVHIKDAFDALARGDRPAIETLTRPAWFVSETKGVAELLRELQVEGQQIAIAVDEFGGTAGLVTIEDLLEEIVGEISDEHEDGEEASWVEVDEGVWLVNGLVRIDALEEILGARLEKPDDDFETVAGLVFKEAGRVPLPGATVNRGGFRFEVDRADRKRIYRVRVSLDDRTALRTSASEA
ncbi:MAG: hemolysin family protein [Acidobacteria bacterium]|nr:hemolysin family protein [Acidobacteriota bacterium]